MQPTVAKAIRTSLGETRAAADPLAGSMAAALYFSRNYL
jgi:hypothetical protein